MVTMTYDIINDVKGILERVESDDWLRDQIRTLDRLRRSGILSDPEPARPVDISMRKAIVLWRGTLCQKSTLEDGL